jgi:epoxyqueuosine reductase
LETGNRHEISQWIKARASELGFAACGIAETAFLEKDEERLDFWLAQGYHGEMAYMARNREKRMDPRLLLPGARSVIVMLMNYFPGENLPEKDNYKISRYAYGKDYHDVIKEKLSLLISGLKQRAGAIQARAFTDSAPVLERAWAEKAGLGWIGKNSCLIHPKIGSFVFIGEIITDLELEYDDQKINDLCGGCNKCAEACPTDALIAPRILDSRKCISYLTIESRDELPLEVRGKFNDWIFGCDICQDVCPWNRKAKSHQEKEFKPKAGLPEMNKTKWEQLTRDEFNNLFSDSAVQRTGYEGLKRNIFFLKKPGN